jgi:hypothetical protein
MKRKGAAFWIEHIASIKREAISTSAYAKRHKIALKSLYYWQRKLDAGAAPHIKLHQPKAFVTLRISDPVIEQRPTNFTVVLRSGIRLELSVLPDPQWLAALDCAAQGAH